METSHTIRSRRRKRRGQGFWEETFSDMLRDGISFEGVAGDVLYDNGEIAYNEKPQEQAEKSPCACTGACTFRLDRLHTP
mmetsp:Transcript_86627/g.278117  ORF Transcript_86627/g.278117 Transcript_86627/m.278117 type:complete len:80 (-) Transcript_86627:255-494(-)